LKNNLKFTLKIQLALLGIFLYASAIHAADLTLTWDDPDGYQPDGYKLYYKQNGPGPPWNGKGAIEGNSPINVGDVNEFTVHGLDDGSAYYFVITAYSDGSESSISNGVFKLANISDERVVRKKYEARIDKKISQIENRINKVDTKIDKLNYWIWGILLALIAGLVSTTLLLVRKPSTMRSLKEKDISKRDL
jgi:hypothetical protein